MFGKAIILLTALLSLQLQASAAEPSCSSLEGNAMNAADENEAALQQGLKHAEAEEYEEALPCYMKAAEADGNMHAMYNLGIMYGFAQGVEHDLAKAALWWTKAAEAGHQEALFWLGVCYWKGAGVPVDRDKARALWEKSESVDAHHYLDYTQDGVNIDNDFGRLMTGVSSEDE